MPATQLLVLGPSALDICTDPNSADVERQLFERLAYGSSTMATVPAGASERIVTELAVRASAAGVRVLWLENKPSVERTHLAEQVLAPGSIHPLARVTSVVLTADAPTRQAPVAFLRARAERYAAWWEELVGGGKISAPRNVVVVDRDAGRGGEAGSGLVRGMPARTTVQFVQPSASGLSIGDASVVCSMLGLAMPPPRFEGVLGGYENPEGVF